MKFSTHRKFLLLLLAGAVALICNTALARAGGGGAFSSGGGGGGGGGDFSGGGDDGGLWILIHFLLRLIIEKPLVGIPLAAIIAVALYYSAKNGRSAGVSRTIRRGHAAAQSARLHTELEKIAARDPAFNAENLCRRCAGVLPDIQRAWSAQEMTPVRHFLSDGVFERFTLQLAMQKACGVKNMMHTVQVLRCRPLDASSDDFFDTLHVAVTASAVDRLVTLEGNRALQGSSAAEQFTEIWTFLRRPGAQTLERPGLLEGFCPNCGTQLRLATSTTCESCEALINSGEYDWVLSEITQEELWRPHSGGAIRGVDALRRRDPGFNTQAIEDRTSAIFWHHRAAEFFARETLLNAVALPQFTERERHYWKADEQGRRRFYADAAVGSVDLAEVTPGAAPDEPDRVRVLVEWSGHRILSRVPALIKPQWHLSRLMRQEYTLMRKQGVPSIGRAALTSLHCPGCGAAQTAESTGECRYCGLSQNDGGSGWVLESVAPFRGFAHREETHENSADPDEANAALGVRYSAMEQESMIQCLAAVMLADGKVEPDEDRELKKMAAKHGIPPQRLYELVHQVQSAEEVDIPELADHEHRSDFFRGLVRMCLADGSVSASERRVLKSVVARFGYGDVDIDAMISRERADLYRSSKQAIRERRRKL